MIANIKSQLNFDLLNIILLAKRSATDIMMLLLIL